MSPPIPATLWRTQVQDDGEPMIIDGHIVPKGTEIGVNTYAFHHNENIFPDPFCFNPDRWLDCSADGKDEIQRKAFAVFSTGARGCPGKAVAYLEISLVIAKTLWYFDFEPVKGSSDDIVAGTVTRGIPGCKVKEPQFERFGVVSFAPDPLKSTGGPAWNAECIL
ncbi:hypothetical protein DL767_000215 [Monosporascus sp. MG133]|nr:hypothetical protein DL767_000215 [Monosporascus sp. MG133]